MKVRLLAKRYAGYSPRDGTLDQRYVLPLQDDERAIMVKRKAGWDTHGLTRGT